MGGRSVRCEHQLLPSSRIVTPRTNDTRRVSEVEPQLLGLYSACDMRKLFVAIQLNSIACASLFSNCILSALIGVYDERLELLAVSGDADSNRRE